MGGGKRLFLTTESCNKRINNVESVIFKCIILMSILQYQSQGYHGSFLSMSGSRSKIKIIILYARFYGQDNDDCRSYTARVKVKTFQNSEMTDGL